MLNTLKYLNDPQNSLETLKAEFGIKVKEYPDTGLVVLNYDQIESPRFNQIADECRGLILHRDGDGWFTLVSKSFDRFYNLGEGNTKIDDWSEWEAEEKADGSIIKVYYFNGKWEISTRGLAHAEGMMGNGEKTFRKAVLDTLHFTEEEFQDWADEHLLPWYTYIFEYIGPDNRVVTRYTTPELVIIAVSRNLEDELGESYHEKHRVADSHPNIRLPKCYEFDSSDEMEKMLSSLTNLEEGFVIRNKYTEQRVKVKSIAYLKAHRIRGESGIPTLSDVAELIVENEYHEFLGYFPEFAQLFDRVRLVWEDLISDAERVYNDKKDIEVQKDFALAIKGHPMTSIMFTTRANKSTIRHTIAESKTTAMVKILLGAVKQ